MVKIISDTTSGITPEEASRLGIGFLPQIIIFGEETYRDDIEINTETFLKKLRASSLLPKTAAPPPELYKPIYEELVKKGEAAIVICPSAELSGTFRSATIATQDFADLKIRIIDSRSIAGGLATLVLQAVAWAKEGMDCDTIAERVIELAARETVYYVVDTLEYLHKGGRIGGAAALVGGILQVKPILTLKNGRAEPLDKQRTKQRAIARLEELIHETYPHGKNGYLSVMHGDAPSEAEKLAATLNSALGIAEIPVYHLPPAILVHAGPGVLGVSFFRQAA